MARSHRRVFQIARLAGRAAAETLAIVRSLGVTADSPNALVPERFLDAVDKAVGINRYAPPVVRDKRDRSGDATGAAGGTLAAADPEPRVLEAPEAVAVEPKPRLPKWDTVGHPTNRILFVTTEQVENIHWLLVDDFKKSKDPIDPPGVRSKDLLDSAVHRMRTSLGQESKYPTVPMAAAALLHAITNNHAFHNGNKRTALVATLAFLDINGFLLEADQDELFDYMVQIADHKVTDREPPEGLADREVLEIARWIHRQSRPISSEEKILKFHAFKAILAQYGCTFDHPTRGNRINIRRPGRVSQVAYRNEGTDVDRNTIRKVRQDLGLTDAEGYDSAIFYEAAERIPDFIHNYRRTLDRLAKV